jgi:DNA recombination protein RmuC
MLIQLPLWGISLLCLFLIAISALVTRALVSRNWQIQVTEERLELERKIVELTTQLAEEQRRFKDFQDQDQDRAKHLQGEFERLANRIFEDKQSRFSKESKESIDTTLKPLREQVDNFRKRVEEVHTSDVADRNRLKGQIEELQKQTSQIGTDAVSLANALKGDSKMQGNWGEVVLERLLEKSGLVKGAEYKTQESFKDESGSRSIPDVIVQLPEERVMIIDSKVSLKHYQAYVNEDDEGKKKELLAQHINSLRTHYTGLAKKQYQHLEGIKTVDFVFMFVPVEPAYLLALRESPELFDEAFAKQVTLVSHTTMMPMLKTVQSLWRNEKQNRNALEIARSAGELHDKFVLMLESLDEIGQQLDKTQEAYKKTRDRLGEGRGNLIGWVGKLETLGAKTRKEMPASVKHLLKDEGESESESESEDKDG